MLVGAIVLVIAVLALRNPKSHVAAVSASGSASSTSSTASRSPSTSGSKSTSKPTSKAKAQPATRTSSTPSRTSSTTASADVKSVPLIVLNNTETSGLAAQAAKRFENGGWTVSSTGNLTNNIVSTCAYYDPSSPGAHAAAQALAAQYPTIKRVKERFAQLPSGPVVVVLTSDYAAD